ncbi:MAG: DUF2634 domain-containing protein [Oscillospiraceae bacterium]
MTKTLFPIIPPISAPQGGRETLPMYRDVAWDFEADKPIFRGGEPLMLEGAEAVLVWCKNALRTERYRYEIYSFRHGCELGNLTGQSYSEATKLAEAKRYVEECLTASPYVLAAQADNLSFQGDVLHMDLAIETVYGGVKLHE